MLFSSSTQLSDSMKNRCGCWDNSPGETTLTDSEGEWTVRIMGFYESEGDWSPNQKADKPF
jgi:hypothetical protein